jgi:hypothetical protein
VRCTLICAVYSASTDMSVDLYECTLVASKLKYTARAAVTRRIEVKRAFMHEAFMHVRV